MPTVSFEGISILIPVFNYPIEPLISSLSHQLKKIQHEIIVYDDFSEEYFKQKNRNITNIYNLQYLELENNIGRSTIRNLLAQKAKFKNILFLDCDSIIEEKNFIINYIQYANHPVVVGGRKYHHDAPETKYLLHWQVGRAKEVRSLEDRRNNPYDSFMFNNILLNRDLFLSIQLDESIVSYGHEDTKFGNILKGKNIPVLHIDNPVIHEGLDENEKFLEKTIYGVYNLYNLTVSGYGTSASLFKASRKIINYSLDSMLIKLISFLLPVIKSNLLSSKPSLFLYDLFKLYYFLKFSKAGSLK